MPGSCDFLLRQGFEEQGAQDQSLAASVILLERSEVAESMSSGLSHMNLCFKIVIARSVATKQSFCL
jgi:hypothetical protein